MKIQIQAISVNTNHIPNAKGGYDVAEIAYKDLTSGKVGGKKIMSFVDKELFATVKGAVPYTNYEIEMLKEPGNDGKEYWQWKSFTQVAAGAVTAPETKAFSAPRSNYETPEERLVRQEQIVRQSSLNYAITLLKTEKNTPSFADVTALASQFVDWVHNKQEPQVANDDIPY